jgi:carbon dioxide concentrating mechanism protein CcmO
MVGASDAMLKAADVVLAAYETIGAGLCTAIIRGSVSNVAMALDVGMVEAERIGELHAVMMVPRPLEDLDQTLPLASCWIEELQPLRLPIALKDSEREFVALPELQQERTPLALAETDKERIDLSQAQTTPVPSYSSIDRSAAMPAPRSSESVTEEDVSGNQPMTTDARETLRRKGKQ